MQDLPTPHYLLCVALNAKISELFLACALLPRNRIYDDEKSTADEERGSPAVIISQLARRWQGGGTQMAIIYFNYEWLGMLAFRTYLRT